MSRINGSLRHTFSGTGRSPSRWTTKEKTLYISASDAFQVNAEASYDDGVTWNVIENFQEGVVKNFEWLGNAALISFNCTSFTANPVEIIFE